MKFEIKHVSSDPLRRQRRTAFEIGKKDQAMSIQLKAAPAQQGTNALELFRSGRDYIEIAAILGVSVPSVEIEIHRLRSAEKGDTAQQDHTGSEIRRFPRRAARPGAPVNFAGGRRRLRV
jgi:DNA-directed RNA polymerase specialized sigma24 family protein